MVSTMALASTSDAPRAGDSAPSTVATQTKNDSSPTPSARKRKRGPYRQLSEHVYRTICIGVLEGDTQAELAARFNLSWNTVHSIYERYERTGIMVPDKHSANKGRKPSMGEVHLDHLRGLVDAWPHASIKQLTEMMNQQWPEKKFSTSVVSRVCRSGINVAPKRMRMDPHSQDQDQDKEEEEEEWEKEDATDHDGSEDQEATCASVYVSL